MRYFKDTPDRNPVRFEFDPAKVKMMKVSGQKLQRKCKINPAWVDAEPFFLVSNPDAFKKLNKS